MAITAPTNSLTGQSIANSYDQVLFLDNLDGMVDDTPHVVSAVVGKSALSIDNNKILVKTSQSAQDNAAAFDVQQYSGTSIFKIAADTPAATLVGTLTVGVDDTGSDVRFYSATASEGLFYDASEDELGLLLTTKLKFHDIGGGEEIYASANGHLEINAGTTLDITAPTVDINTATELNIDTVLYDLNASGAATLNSTTFAISGTTIDIDGSGAMQLNSSGGTIGIGNDAVAQAMNIGTGAAARTITMGNVTGATAVNLNSGTGGVTLASTGAGDITLDSADDIEINADGGTVTIKDGSDSHFLLDCDATALTIYDDTSASDYCKILVAANGATTISTNDNDGTSGDLTLDVDGDIILDADGSQISMKWGGEAGQIDFTNANSGDGVIQQKVNAKDLVIQQYNGTEVCRFEDGGTVRVGPAAGSDDWFRLPAVDGSANQVLSTDGDGAVTWASQTNTAATADDATNFFCTANNSTDETVYPVFVDGATGNQGGETDTGLTYNPSTGLMTATAFSGNLTGTLQTAAQTNITSVGTLTSLTVDGALTAGSLALDSISNASGNVTLDASEDVILDADGDDFIFKVGGATTSSQTDPDARNELMRITWGNGGSSQGAWNTGFYDKSVIRFQHVAKLTDDGEEPSSPVFQFAALDIDSFDAPEAGCFGEITKDGFLGYGHTGDAGTGNQCLGNGRITSSAWGNVLINRGAAADLSGDDNVAIGYKAMENSIRNRSCVVIGSYAGTDIGKSANETGESDHNICIGRSSGNTIDEGYNNTAIGYTSAKGLTTGYNNICIGSYTRPSTNNGYGQIIIGNGTSGGMINGAGNDRIKIASTSTTYVSLHLNGSTEAWSAGSDERLKENIVPSTVGLSFINDLNPVTFDWKKEKDLSGGIPGYVKDSDKPCRGDYGKTYYGFIAQEVKKVIDAHKVYDGHNIWHEDPEGIQELAKGNLVPMLVKAVQELSARVEHLEANNKTVTHIN